MVLSVDSPQHCPRWHSLYGYLAQLSERVTEMMSTASRKLGALLPRRRRPSGLSRALTGLISALKSTTLSLWVHGVPLL